MSAPGEVVRIRVNPRDCMSVADVCAAVGVNWPGMSFSQACSVAFSALLETMRDAGTIPRREGFEFSEVMANYKFKQRTGRKLALTRAVTYAGDEAQVPALTIKPPALSLTTEQRQAKLRYIELCHKRDAGAVFTEADEQEWTQVIGIMSGD